DLTDLPALARLSVRKWTMEPRARRARGVGRRLLGRAHDLHDGGAIGVVAESPHFRLGRPDDVPEEPGLGVDDLLDDCGPELRARLLPRVAGARAQGRAPRDTSRRSAAADTRGR